MKNKLTNLYDHITMPPECVQRIEKALAQEQPEPNWVVQKQAAQSQSGWWFLPAAVCLVLAVMILLPSLAASVTLSPSATQPIALELPDFLVQNDDILFFTCGDKKPVITGEYVIVPSGSDALRINNLLSMDDPLVYLDQQKDGTWNYYAIGGRYENKVLDLSTVGWAAWTDVVWDENGKLISFGSLESANTQTHTGEKQPWFCKAEEKLAMGWGLEHTAIPEEGQLPQWLQEENGRLYFTFNGAKTDITKVISGDTPFLFCYYGVLRETRYFAVGGSYDPEAGALESIGWAEWNHSHQVRPGNEGGYVGCHFHNTQDASGQRHSWYSRAIEEMNLFNGPGLDTLIPQTEEIAETVLWNKELDDGTVLCQDIGQLPHWLAVKQDLLYFQSGGKHTNITTKLSQDVPLLFVRQTEDTLYYYAIGCSAYAYNPGAIHPGWALWAKSRNKPDAFQLLEAENWCSPAEGIVYPWYVTTEEIVKEGQTASPAVFPEAVPGKQIILDIDIGEILP